MSRQPDRPLNVLLITADQYRGDFLSCTGHPVVRTPHLDALAQAGACFPNAYSPVPICVPARYSIMTGQVPIAFGVRGNGGRIPADYATLPVVFGRAGYATGAIGKMHFSPWRDPHGFGTFTVSEEGRQWNHPQGPDDYQRYLHDVGWGGYERAHGIGNNDVHTSASPLPLEHYHTTWAARETERWIERQLAEDAGRPFFAWCSFTKPHSPYDPPEPFDRLYDPRTFPRPIGDAADLEGLSPTYQQSRNSHLWDTLGPEQIQRARAFYAGSCALIDQMVGRLRAALVRLGVSDRTVILFTADHGDLLGDHGLFFKTVYYRASWHVPFVLYAPGRLEALGQAERFVRTEDIFPTLLAAAGVPLPESLQPLHGEDVTAASDEGPVTIFGSVRGAPDQLHTARTRRWSYVVHARGAYEELYDLQADPDERANLIPPDGAVPAAHAATATELRSRLERWLAEVRDAKSLDSGGRLLVDPSQRGWQPAPPPRTALGLRPY